MSFPAHLKPLFNAAAADRAHEEWGMNCGPGALAAVMRMTLDEVRPHLSGFEERRYTNPTMMNDALRSIGKPWRKIGAIWPQHGLVRVQWEGPWTRPGVPMRARYRFTHWIGAAIHAGEIGVFDINLMGNGTGWTALANWQQHLVPWLLENCVPRADGNWHITHAIEVEPPKVAP
jgi:hypothetical protein